MTPVAPLHELMSSPDWTEPSIGEGQFADDVRMGILDDWSSKARTLAGTEDDHKALTEAYYATKSKLLESKLNDSIVRSTPESMRTPENLATLRSAVLQKHYDPGNYVNLSLDEANPSGRGNDSLLPSERRKIEEWSSPLSAGPPKTRGDAPDNPIQAAHDSGVEQVGPPASASLEAVLLNPKLEEDHSEARRRDAKFGKQYAEALNTAKGIATHAEDIYRTKNWTDISDPQGTVFSFKRSATPGTAHSYDIRVPQPDGSTKTITTEELPSRPTDSQLTEIMAKTLRANEGLFPEDGNWSNGASPRSRLYNKIGAPNASWDSSLGYGKNIGKALDAAGNSAARGIIGAAGSIVGGLGHLMANEDDIAFLKSNPDSGMILGPAGPIDRLGATFYKAAESSALNHPSTEARMREAGGTQLERDMGIVKGDLKYNDWMHYAEKGAEIGAHIGLLAMTAGGSEVAEGASLAGAARSVAAVTAPKVPGLISQSVAAARNLFAGNATMSYIAMTSAGATASAHNEIYQRLKESGMAPEEAATRANKFAMIEGPASMAVNLLSGHLITENAFGSSWIRKSLTDKFASQAASEGVAGAMTRATINGASAVLGDAVISVGMGVANRTAHQFASEIVSEGSPYLEELKKGRSDILGGIPGDLAFAVAAAGVFGNKHPRGLQEAELVGRNISAEHQDFIDSMRYKVLKGSDKTHVIQMPGTGPGMGAWYARFDNAEGAGAFREALVGLENMTSKLYDINPDGTMIPKKGVTEQNLADLKAEHDAIMETVNFQRKRNTSEVSEYGVSSHDSLQEAIATAKELYNNHIAGNKPVETQIHTMAHEIAQNRVAGTDWDSAKAKIVESLTKDRELNAGNAEEVARRKRDLLEKINAAPAGTPEYDSLLRQWENVGKTKGSKIAKGHTPEKASEIADSLIEAQKKAAYDIHYADAKPLAENAIIGRSGTSESPNIGQAGLGVDINTTPISMGAADNFTIDRNTFTYSDGSQRTKWEIRAKAGNVGAGELPPIVPRAKPPILKKPTIDPGTTEPPSSGPNMGPANPPIAPLPQGPLYGPAHDSKTWPGAPGVPVFEKPGNAEPPKSAPKVNSPSPSKSAKAKAEASLSESNQVILFRGDTDTNFTELSPNSLGSNTKTLGSKVGYFFTPDYGFANGDKYVGRTFSKDPSGRTVSNQTGAVRRWSINPGKVYRVKESSGFLESDLFTSLGEKIDQKKNSGENARKWLIDNGYDSVMFEGDSHGSNVEMLVINPKNAKLVDPIRSEPQLTDGSVLSEALAGRIKSGREKDLEPLPLPEWPSLENSATPSTRMIEDSLTQHGFTPEASKAIVEENLADPNLPVRVEMDAIESVKAKREETGQSKKPKKPAQEGTWREQALAHENATPGESPITAELIPRSKAAWSPEQLKGGEEYIKTGDRKPLDELNLNKGQMARLRELRSLEIADGIVNPGDTVLAADDNGIVSVTEPDGKLKFVDTEAEKPAQEPAAPGPSIPNAEIVQKGKLAEATLNKAEEYDLVDDKRGIMRVAKQAVKDRLIGDVEMSSIELMARDRDMGAADILGELRGTLIDHIDARDAELTRAKDAKKAEKKGLKASQSAKDARAKRSSQSGQVTFFSDLAQFAIDAVKAGWNTPKYIVEAIKKFGERLINPIRDAWKSTHSEAAAIDATHRPYEAPAKPVARPRRRRFEGTSLEALEKSTMPDILSEPQRLQNLMVEQRRANAARLGAFNGDKNPGGKIDSVISNALSEIGRIHPELRTVMLDYEFNLLKRHNEFATSVEPMFKKLRSLNSADRESFNSAHRKGGIELQTFLEKKGLSKLWADWSAFSKSVRTDAARAGIDIGMVEDYFPMEVKFGKYNDLESHLRDNSETWGEIEKAWKKVEVNGNSVRILSDAEKVDIANQVMSRPSNKTNSKASNVKSRKIDFFSDDMAKFYEAPDKALHSYIGRMSRAITDAEFFGRDAETKARVSAAEGKTGDSAMRGSSIGETIFKLKQSGQINGKQEREVQRIIQDRLGFKGDPKLLRMAKSGNIYFAMNSPIRAIGQLQELASVAYENGFFNTAMAFVPGVKNQWKNGKLSLADMGIQPGMQVTGPREALSRAADLIWRGSGYKLFDGISASVNSLAHMRKLKSMGESQLTEHLSQFQQLWSRPISEVAAEIRRGDYSSPEVREVAFMNLAKIRPVVLSNMPRQFLRGGPLTRIAYNLKVFQVHQLDYIRNESFGKIAKGDVAAGLGNLVKLGFMLTAAGVGIDQTKDVILGRQTDLEDSALDNMMKLVFMSRYQMDSLGNEGGFKKQMMNVLNMPLLDFMGNLYDAGIKANKNVEAMEPWYKDLEKSKIINQIPSPLGVLQWQYWNSGGAAPEKQLQWIKSGYDSSITTIDDRYKLLNSFHSTKRQATGTEAEYQRIRKFHQTKAWYEKEIKQAVADGDMHSAQAWGAKVKTLAEDENLWDSEYLLIPKRERK